MNNRSGVSRRAEKCPEIERNNRSEFALYQAFAAPSIAYLPKDPTQ